MLTCLELDSVSAFQLEDLPRLRRGRRLESEFFDQPAGLGDLFRVRFREAAGGEPERILETNPDIAAERQGLRSNCELVAAGAQNRPPVVTSEQAIRRAPHMHHVLGMRPNPAQEAEHALNKERRFDQTAVDKMGERVEMADIVALDLEPRAVVGTG